MTEQRLQECWEEINKATAEMKRLRQVAYDMEKEVQQKLKAMELEYYGMSLGEYVRSLEGTKIEEGNKKIFISSYTIYGYYYLSDDKKTYMHFECSIYDDRPHVSAEIWYEKASRNTSDIPSKYENIVKEMKRDMLTYQIHNLIGDYRNKNGISYS